MDVDRLHEQMVNMGEAGPTSAFVEFKKEDSERSIPDRFKQQVRRYPTRLPSRLVTTGSLMRS